MSARGCGKLGDQEEWLKERFFRHCGNVEVVRQDLLRERSIDVGLTIAVHSSAGITATSGGAAELPRFAIRTTRVGLRARRLRGMGHVLGDEVMAAALIDRLLHHWPSSTSGETATGRDSIGTRLRSTSDQPGEGDAGCPSALQQRRAGHPALDDVLCCPLRESNGRKVICDSRTGE